MSDFKKVQSNQNFPEMENEVIKFWEENKIFEKSLESRKGSKEYAFYDGPPFATGTPHYGHLVGSIMKDVVPRYWTMRGYYVERKWGWDCHGLPIENIVEKELGSKKKKDIEVMGVDKFNELCRSKVLFYVDEWKKVIKRLGRWADMENPYKTMDLDYMESVWWVFKELYDKDLIYEGYRSMHICTRCETTLSQQEVAEGYQDIKDLSAIAKFELLSTNYESDTNVRITDDEKTYILAWTTTPWTLIGNVALAVGEDVDYCKVKSQNSKVKSATENLKLKKGESYILAKDRLGEILKDEEYEIVEEFKGKDLVGKEYKPLFDYYQGKGLDNEENGWKIYPADFVTTEEGTGVVHIAPAFGEDDLRLGEKYKLPFVQHVGLDGVIKDEAKDFAGLSVKPSFAEASAGKKEKDSHQKTDIEVIKYLAHNNLLFAKEKYEHSYPHCWRCDTPLINYATSSWFVAVEKIKEKALELAKEINWSPSHMKKGRFGNWLEGARDWSISRQRFWASVMPIWVCDKCGEKKVIGSVEEIREQFGSPNKFFLVRHGEAEVNVKRILNSDIKNNHYHLTEKGKVQIMKIAKELRDKKIDMIFSSPFLRTKETAEIISERLGVEISFDERLKEFGIGNFEGKKMDDFLSTFPDWPEEGDNKRKNFGIESESDARKRFEDFIDEINKKYKNKNIVIISHGDPLQFIYSIVNKLNRAEVYNNDWYPEEGSCKEVYSKFVDLHKHVVDKITFKCDKCKGEMKRVPDVLDTWFDSGSMPYAQKHYPFENEKRFKETFPADFIAEGVDQTRAWFYYLHVIATGIKEKPAFKNVIVNGIVLAEDGKKMAKRLKNYPDPMEMFEKYGADSLRYYLMTSPVVAAQNLNFSESEVSEVVRGMMRMLWNSYSFFVLYANIDKFTVHSSQLTVRKNLLDRWIVSELNVLIRDFNEHMENYDLHKASRLFPKFIDNLSNWYIRRSRKRFWKSENDSDKNEAYATLHHVLVELSKLMAPFTPFIAEEIYRNLVHGSQSTVHSKESVHLEDFPEADEKLIDEKLNDEMRKARETVRKGLQLRADFGIKVRQPLSLLGIKYNILPELLEIIKEEVNVKDVEINKKQDSNVVLNAEITEDLRLEGQAREIIRFIQEMRKEAGYDVDNRIKVYYDGLSEVFDKFGNLIAKETLANEVLSQIPDEIDLEKEFKIEEKGIRIAVKK